ncbi:MAG: PAS domain S-box protein [Spirochaetia bacterium]|nr:PAS domain S-box protein [Spirochaetia bacterium]
MIVGFFFWIADTLHDFFAQPGLGFMSALWQAHNPMEIRERLIGTAFGVFVAVLGVLMYARMERKRGAAERMARRTTRRFEKLWDHLSTGVFISTLDGTFLHINDASWRMAGFASADEAFSIRAQSLYADPADRERMIQGLRDHGVVKNLEMLSRRQDGSTYWISMSAAVIDDEEGEPPHILGMIEDITQRKTVERVLRESEQLFRSIFTMSPAGTIAVDLDYKLIQANPAFCSFLGYEPEELIGRSVREITHPEDRTIGFDYFDLMRDGELEHHKLEKRYVTRDGNTVWAFVSVRSVRDLSGSPLYFLSIVIDITARKKAEAERDAAQNELMRVNTELEKRVRERTVELEIANDELESFSYSVSHDLRAPLRGIDGWTLAILEDYSDKLDDKGKEYLMRVRGETSRMNDLVTNLLSLARVARAEMRTEEISLSRLAQEAAHVVAKTDPSRNVAWIIEPGLTVSGDIGLLEVLMRNLLDNAFKFTARSAAPACIEVGRVKDLPVPTFFVRDNGAGFDPAYADKLFVPFQRLHGISEFPGTGVGLATVQRIVRRHGGRAWAESRPDQGATFYFTLSAPE